jgi:hypothetical protein
MSTAEAIPLCPDPSGGEYSQPPHFLVGRNSRGEWVVRERRARCGGLFNGRAEALRFAFRERGEAPGAVVLVPDVLELFEAQGNGTATSIHGANGARTAAPRILLED